MATGLRLFRTNFPLIFNSVLRNTSVNGTVCFGKNRFIFSDASLGLIGYSNSRLQIHQQFSNVEGSFRQKMNEIIKSENSVVFTEDLKAMLHLVNKNSEDINLILQMINKFNNQNKELRFGTYIFGPVVMRAFYYLDEPDIAVNAFLDSKLTYFFDQNMSYTILLTLLYKHNRYEDMKKVYNVIKTRNVDIQRYPRNSLIVLMAGCYKENTRESLQYALDNWTELHQRGFGPVRRVITFIAGLAIKQGLPEIALEVLTGLKASRYIDNRCLKVVAYCKLNRLVDVVPLMRQSVENFDKRKESYFYDVIDIIEEKAINADEPIQIEIKKLITSLRAAGLVESNQTLETHLLQPIERITINRQRDGSNRNNPRYSNNQYFDRSEKQLGLKDLL